MSKKSYKQLQNRLYREIKRRMIAEMLSNHAVTVCKTTADIETVKIVKVIPFLDYEQEADYEKVKKLLARIIGESLCQSGHIKFSVTREPSPDVNLIRMEATLDVVKDKRALP